MGKPIDELTLTTYTNQLATNLVKLPNCFSTSYCRTAEYTYRKSNNNLRISLDSERNMLQLNKFTVCKTIWSSFERKECCSAAFREVQLPFDKVNLYLLLLLYNIILQVPYTYHAIVKSYFSARIFQAREGDSTSSLHEIQADRVRCLVQSYTYYSRQTYHRVQRSLLQHLQMTWWYLHLCKCSVKELRIRIWISWRVKDSSGESLSGIHRWPG